MTAVGNLGCCYSRLRRLFVTLTLFSELLEKRCTLLRQIVFYRILMIKMFTVKL